MMLLGESFSAVGANMLSGSLCRSPHSGAKGSCHALSSTLIAALAGSLSLSRAGPGSGTGVDISKAMLREAEFNAQAEGVPGITLALSDDGLCAVKGDFDVVHSHIVLQHITWRRGRAILRALAGRVAPDGVLCVQLLSGTSASPLVRAPVRLSYVFRPLNWIRNLVSGRPWSEPAMELHVYNMAQVTRDLKAAGFTKITMVPSISQPEFQFESIMLFAMRDHGANRAVVELPSLTAARAPRVGSASMADDRSSDGEARMQRDGSGDQHCSP